MKGYCQNCRHWLDGSFSGEEGLGQCHRYAPHPVSERRDLEFEYDTVWPVTARVHWCGEWEAVE